MEVHHHSHNPKKWSEYLTEFVMLFAAVTLGFFAENLREHQIEKHREIQYLKNIHLDLQRDMKEADKLISFNTEKLVLGDRLINLYQKGIHTNLPEFYYLTRSLSLRMNFIHTSNGFEQLKNAGGLRLIEDEEIIKKIQTIEIRVGAIETLQNIMEQNLMYYRLKTSQILDAFSSRQMNKNQNPITEANNGVLRRFKMPAEVKPLKVNDDKNINELVNLGVAPINTLEYLNSHLSILKKECLSLDNLLLKKYGKDF